MDNLQISQPMSIADSMVKFVEMAMNDFSLKDSWIDKIEINPVKKEVRLWFAHADFGRSRPAVYRFNEEST